MIFWLIYMEQVPRGIEKQQRSIQNNHLQGEFLGFPGERKNKFPELLGFPSKLTISQEFDQQVMGNWKIYKIFR